MALPSDAASHSFSNNASYLYCVSAPTAIAADIHFGPKVNCQSRSCCKRLKCGPTGAPEGTREQLSVPGRLWLQSVLQEVLSAFDFLFLSDFSQEQGSPFKHQVPSCSLHGAQTRAESNALEEHRKPKAAIMTLVFFVPADAKRPRRLPKTSAQRSLQMLPAGDAADVPKVCAVGLLGSVPQNSLQHSPGTAGCPQTSRRRSRLRHSGVEHAAQLFGSAADPLSLTSPGAYIITLKSARR